MVGIILMGTYFDDKEIQDPEKREKEHFKKLVRHIRFAKKNAPYFKKLFKDINPAEISDRSSLARLPITRKSELVETQADRLPLGGLNAVPLENLKHIFQSPGPTYDAEGYGVDWWGTGRALFASGFRKGDIIHNSFSYHLTPAGTMLETGAHALSCLVFPAGVGNTEIQAQAIQDIQPTAYVGTPSFLKILLAKAEEVGKDTSSLKKACVGGEGLTSDLRNSIEEHGIKCGQIYASADLGNIAYESEAREGLIVDERLLIEIVGPGTDKPVSEGEVGEVVVTLFRPEYPLIRFATGDLSAILPGQSPCGRTNLRIKGWMGRADQTTKIKGMFVHPAQISRVVTRHEEIKKARLIVTKVNSIDKITLRFESNNQSTQLIKKIEQSIFTICNLKGSAEQVALGSLPNDGKVIDDLR